MLRDVVITQGDMRIQADEAQHQPAASTSRTASGPSPATCASTAEGGSLSPTRPWCRSATTLISRATITGAPAQFEQQREDGTTARGHANTIDYETASGTVSFNDEAWLSDGCNEITGQQLVYNIRTQSVQGQSAQPAPRTGDGRVRIVIQPDKPPSGKPVRGAREKKP